MKRTAYAPMLTTPELKARLIAMAKKQRRTVSWLLNEYAEKGLDRDEKKFGKAKKKKKKKAKPKPKPKRENK